MKEIWADVAGYENLYQISNCGNIKSKTRYKRNNDGVMLLKARTLKQHPNSRGYFRVELVDEHGKHKKFFIHRLVALHFVDNPNPSANHIVNHLDSDHTNNRADNLEWTTPQGNVEHAVRNGRMKHSAERKRHLREACEKNGKTVIGVNIKTGEVIRFICLNDCKNKGFQPSCVCDCCKGKRQTHGGYRWRYE
jgi:hypothetical protein